MCLLLVLFGAFFFVVCLHICICTFWNNVSLLVIFITYGISLPIIIIWIVVIFYVLLRKFNSICWLGRRPWLPVHVFIKQLVCIDHVFRVIFIPLGVVIFQLFNKTTMSISIILTNKCTYQVLFLGFLL